MTQAMEKKRKLCFWKICEWCTNLSDISNNRPTAETRMYRYRSVRINCNRCKSAADATKLQTNISNVENYMYDPADNLKETRISKMWRFN